MRILIVEDEQEIRNGIRNLLIGSKSSGRLGADPACSYAQSFDRFHHSKRL